jgi:hypothetical protein
MRGDVRGLLLAAALGVVAWAAIIGAVWLVVSLTK